MSFLFFCQFAVVGFTLRKIDGFTLRKFAGTKLLITLINISRVSNGDLINLILIFLIFVIFHKFFFLLIQDKKWLGRLPDFGKNGGVKDKKLS